MISVVVLSWNNRDVIERCLDSVRALAWDDLQIIVIDNGSVDGSAELLRRQRQIELFELPRNIGFAGGQVFARSRIRGEHTLLLNSDAVIDPEWLTMAVPELDDPRVAAVGGRAHMWSGVHAAWSRSSPFYSFQVIDPWTASSRTMTDGDAARDVDGVSGAGVLIRVAALDAVGGFDRRFFAYYEETDLFARMQRAGWRVRYTPHALIWHAIRGSTREHPGRYEYFMLRNRALFAIRNLDQPNLRVAIASMAREYRAQLRRGHPLRRVTARALLSLAWLLPHALRSRRHILRLGDSYCRQLSSVASTDVTIDLNRGSEG